jgi:predicted TIM-barrel fold metal-dependent hydrolase
MIIDAHTHIHPDSRGFGERYDASLKNLITCLDNSPVDMAIILPISPMVPNEFIVEACNQYPNRLLGFASVNPLEGENAADQLETYIKRNKLKGLKLHPRLQNFDLSNPAILPVFKRSAELGIPILIDAFPGMTDTGTVSIPIQIGKIAAIIPDAKLIIAHAGGYKILDSLFIAKKHCSIYLDLSYSLNYFRSSSIEQDIHFVIKKLGANRCIYGSDHPELPLDCTYFRTVEQMKSKNLSEEEINFIFGGTIESLLVDHNECR